jgi:hypothetical protein
VFDPLVAYSVSGLNPDITDATSVLKELMLSPLGTVFEPLDAPDDDGDELQAAAAKVTTAARLTQATGRSERERRPPLLLCIPQTPFHLSRNTPETTDAGNHTAHMSTRKSHPDNGKWPAACLDRPAPADIAVWSASY